MATIFNVIDADNLTEVRAHIAALAIRAADLAGIHPADILHDVEDRYLPLAVLIAANMAGGAD
jgi:hypothetical protein